MEVLQVSKFFMTYRKLQNALNCAKKAAFGMAVSPGSSHPHINAFVAPEHALKRPPVNFCDLSFSCSQTNTPQCRGIFISVTL